MADVTTTIAPMLAVRRGAQAVEFYKAAFGAREVFRIDDDAERWWRGSRWTARSSG
jgi:uncharacterized glyoxalase superfamily protein PhnB